MSNFIKEFFKIFCGSKLTQTTVSHENKGAKTFMSSTEHLTLNAQNQKQIEDTKISALNIAKENDFSPAKLLEYIKNSGTEVHYTKNAAKLLKIIGEDEGFITELNGLKAVYLNVITQNGFAPKTSPMFVLHGENLDPAIFLHHFYKWFALKNNLGGFEYKTQQNFKKYFKNMNIIETLPIEEMLDLKEAIARDKEATEFALNFVRETQGAKNVQKKMTDGGANI